MGNLAFALSANWLLINTFVSCINFRLFGFSLRACLTETIISSYNLQLCLTEVVMFPATRSLSAVFLSSQTARFAVQRNCSGNQGIIRCQAGVGGQSSRAAMESPKALMCPLEKGDDGLTSRHQTTGRVRVFAIANTWRTQRPRGASGFGTESQ